MSMIHTVVAQNPNNEIVEVITCFSERQIPIAKRAIDKSFPGSTVTVKSYADHHDGESDRK